MRRALRAPLDLSFAAVAAALTAGCGGAPASASRGAQAPVTLPERAAPAEAPPPPAEVAVDPPRSTQGPLDAVPRGAAAEPRQGGDEPACSDGLSCATRGRAYELGDGETPRDPVRALEYYLKACDYNEKTGCNNYGYMILNGVGAPADPPRGLSYLQKACDLGSGSGCHNLGYAYENSQGVPRDMTVAVELFRRSCSLGQASGCRALGLCYHYGLGLAADAAQAVQYLRKGCAGGDATGCDKLKELGVTP